MVRLIMTLLPLLAAALITLGAYILKKRGKSTSVYVKAAALTLAAVAFARYIYAHPAVYSLTALKNDFSRLNGLSAAGGNTAATLIGLLLVWFVYAAMLTTVMSAFFGFNTLHRIVTCFSAPVYILTIALHEIYSEAVLGHASTSLSTVRLWILAIEAAIALSIPLIYTLVEKRVSVPKTKKDVKTFFCALPFAILAAMPSYVPKALIGNLSSNLKIFDLTEEHRFVLYFAIIIPYIIYLAIKDKPLEVKRFLMIYLSVAILWIYLGKFDVEMLTVPNNWPLHLCNTALFLIPLCLIFKLDRLFNFCLFINVMGAFLAMVMPSELPAENAIGTLRVSYWLNHYAAFFFPVLLVALKLFKRPKFKEWVWAVIELTVYFVAMLFLNAWFENYDPNVDYFYLNSDFIASKLGVWAERTRNFTVSFNIGELKFTFYPLYQFLYYVVYMAVTVGIWFLYELLFTSWDVAEDRRKRERDYKLMKKELHEYLGDRPEYLPQTGDDTPHLVIRNFSKRYGSNKHYSVRGVSLDVHGGEIFGFLGPNGAGKSTIIKSVVGIQTITEGQIEICGYDINSQAPAAKLHLGFVPDHYALYENLTGREYINYIADLYAVSQEYRNEVIEKLVTRFQLTGSFDNQMKTYSHGMKQKITIMAALVHNPKVWILDEPLTGLDPTSIYEVKECMKEHAAKGNVVFFSSHIIDLVEKLCDRIAIIKKGQLRACTSIKELGEKGIELERFYLDIINSGDDEHVPYVEPQEITESAEGTV